MHLAATKEKQLGYSKRIVKLGVLTQPSTLALLSVFWCLTVLFFFFSFWYTWLFLCHYYPMKTLLGLLSQCGFWSAADLVLETNTIECQMHVHVVQTNTQPQSQTFTHALHTRRGSNTGGNKRQTTCSPLTSSLSYILFGNILLSRALWYSSRSQLDQNSRYIEQLI